MAPGLCRILRVTIAAALLLCGPPGQAAPRLPIDDREVLERLPFTVGDLRLRELRPLRAALARNPRDLRAAVALARACVEAGRTTGDPRYSGYAEAALAPWWALPEPPAEVLILRAVLLQRVHRFEAALADLDRLLAHQPRHAQAHLTRATILQVQGRLDEAGRACEALRGLVPPLHALSCAASVAGSTGRLGSALADLATALARTPDADAGTRAWVLGTLAELSERAGHHGVADAHFRAALSADPDDQYLLAAYADFLLARGRSGAVRALLAKRGRADGLLLRLALAATANGDPGAVALTEQLRARFDAAARRGDRVHLREEARYTLHLLRDPHAALALALDNWALQKEPADLLVLAEAASATGDRDALAMVRAWRARTGFEDIRIDAALGAPPHPGAVTLRSAQ